MEKKQEITVVLFSGRFKIGAFLSKGKNSRLKAAVQTVDNRPLFRGGCLFLVSPALSGFEGTVLLVSHEEAFYQDWAQSVINIEKK